MESSELFLIIVTAGCLYCMGASWMLQFVCYPTYLLVGEKEFVPFHISFGRRLLAAAVIPMVITNFASLALPFIQPSATPQWAGLAVAACAIVILGTTAILEVPKHMRLDKEGKSDALLNALVRDNLPRTFCWTLASLLLVYMVISTFQA